MLAVKSVKVIMHNTNPTNPADGQIGTVKSALLLDGHQGGSYDVVDDTFTVVVSNKYLPHPQNSVEEKVCRTPHT